MTISAAQIIPVVLSGGSGTRLWPLSTPQKPKQFHRLIDDNTMFQQTCLRVSPSVDPRFGSPMVICNTRHEDYVIAQLEEASITTGTVIAEPTGRNSAPAIAIASLHAHAKDPDALLLILPSDHAIPDVERFRDSIFHGIAAAQRDFIVTLGIRPTGPETGYGYINAGEKFDDHAAKVKRFVEKPDRETAEGYLAAGDYLWNAGMFLFKASAMLAALRQHAPDLLAQAQVAYASAKPGGRHIRLPLDQFSKCRSISIDYAVMEKADNVAVVPVDFAWSDLGSWASIWEQSSRDGENNSLHGAAVASDSRNNLIFAEGISVGVIGVEGLVVVATPNGVLVVPRDRTEEVRKIVDALMPNS
ncbi:MULTISPECIES: mannose-1-phosphate guanylyltransferase/mannose-6-phosphate isomerase [unclassified Beijerinckia]|uniref:mannose-1-phosphate guanylyltransferase/mannose-6-phosphate isomerase n=1 Tax=unclassified Beijerinckia TaxID=2638183 RepID=UPI00089C2693|nr:MULTISPECIES: mannose-1-phosphate guanylyltransferase/mannose-6-phosphate isomerase [unclassified Beijerinckia]MDH7794362.1 mannose-1-phosphate guanylyltransferase/mannose-6-phosphate isomerase [Beijerinckia sp. GAS462]SEB59973.1 mannose-1-phosphate guanylyltransferase / mannose-6-phosphate isomerase [Beijerinckia sp. 28-YEA-48]